MLQEETAKRKTGRQTDREERQMKMGEAGEAIQMLPLAPGARSRAALTPKQKRNLCSGQIPRSGQSHPWSGCE